MGVPFPFSDRSAKPRQTISRHFLPILLCLTAIPAHGELITVGSTANGCEFDSLVFAIVRAALTPEADTIAIAEDLTYTNTVPLMLNNEAKVTFQGVFSCGNTSPFQRRITATRGGLISFTDTDLTVNDLWLISDENGGRLLRGAGSMLITLNDVRVQGGKGDLGGNLRVDLGASALTQGQVFITDGQASSHGGGIFCSGGGTVALTQGTLVEDNHAELDGGGIYALDCAVNVLTGGPGPGTLSSYGVNSNTAGSDGGGIYATGGGDVIIAGTSTRPATLAGNLARSRGGGVYLISPSSRVRVHDAEILSNQAFEDGGAFHVSVDAQLEMDRTLETCARGVRCSLLDGNVVGGPVGTVSLGGAIAVKQGGRVEIRQTYISGNGGGDGGQIALVEDADSWLLMEGVTIFANDPRGRHVLVRDGGHARLAFVSAWGNAHPGFGRYFLAGETGGRIDLYSSLVIEGLGSAPTGGGPDRVFAPSTSGGVYNAECVMAHEIGSMLSLTSLVETDPAAVWLDPASGDPHLRPSARAIDYCNTNSYTPTDLDVDNQPRGVDNQRPDLLGVFDLGADEFHATTEAFFVDDFEPGNTNVWDSTLP